MQSNDKGFTLVEVMVAMLISLLVFLGLMQSGLAGIDQNMRNHLREEAIGIAEMDVVTARNSAYPPAPVVNATVARNFRSIQGFNYTVNRNLVPVDVCHTQVNITVSWPWKGQTFNHTTSTILRDPSC